MAQLITTPYVWQKALWQHVLSARLAERLPHALLFTGLPGMGKQHFARVLAHSLLCKQPTSEWFACGDCTACRLLMAGTHPDLQIISPEEAGRAIKINQIRQINHFTQQTGFSESYRIVILYPAEKMNHAAANALLKTLEEPGEGILFILLTEHAQQMLATIRSRCQRLHFPPVEPSMTLDFLQAEGFTDHQVSLSAQLSQGAPLRALALLAKEELQQREQVFTVLIALAKGQTDPMSAAKALLSLPFEQLLSWMLVWIIDACRLNMHFAIEGIFNRDYQACMQELFSQFDPRWLLDYYALLLTSKAVYLRQINLNQQLLLETMLCIYTDQLPIDSQFIHQRFYGYTTH